MNTTKEMKEIDFLYAKHNANAKYKLDASTANINFPKYISKIVNKSSKRTKREKDLLSKYRRRILTDLKDQSYELEYAAYLKRVASRRIALEEKYSADSSMVKLFGIWKKKSNKLSICRDNYALINKKCSFDTIFNQINYPNNPKIQEKFEDETCQTYSDQWCEKHRADCLVNFDLNMSYFEKLSEAVFNSELNTFLSKVSKFEQIFDLNELEDITGIYMLVLDKYKQVYIGQSKNIKKRIMQHWNTTKAFDRLIFGTVNTSVLSIDSFGALDTTRIYVYRCGWLELNGIEEKLVKLMNPNYMLNRTAGGIGDSYDATIDVMAGAKYRKLK